MRVLVVCVENWDTVAEIPYMLHTAGCRVDVFCSKDSWLLKNNYYDSWIERDAYTPAYIAQLGELVEEAIYDWFILADVVIKEINESRLPIHQLQQLLPISALEHRAILSSKIGLANFCLENNIPTPGYAIYNTRKDLEILQSTLQFPVINKIDFSWGGANMFDSENLESFEENLHQLPLNQNTMIQEYVVGEELPVEALFYKGELVEYMTSRILQYDKGPFSLSTRRSYYANTAIEPYLIAIGRKLGITGFANMAYLKEATTGIYKLIEIDLRPNSWMAYGKFCHKDFSKALKSIINENNQDLLEEPNNTSTEVEIALFYKDLRRSFWQRDLKSALQWVFNYKSYWRFIPFYDWNLLKSILYQLGDIIKHKANKINDSVSLPVQIDHQVVESPY